MSLINLPSRSSQNVSSSSVHLEDIPEGSPLYAELQAYLSQKEKGDTFASIAKDDVDDIKSYEKRKDEPWKIFQHYLINGLYFPEFSIPSIHKWTPELGYIEEQIPCLYRICYNNFWDKMMKKNPKMKELYGQELLDFMTQKIRDYSTETHKIVVTDPSIKHIARRIFIQDGNTDDMINNHLEEVRRNILLNITHYAKSDTSMRSETSEDAQEYKNTQPCGDSLQQTKDFLFNLKGKEV
ncbi:hypothetical protein H5410_059075 [Solanum commersonii]|uniref:Uncharacterized protein n=1 Tax=Solanum commersonii TaxID=4109 RepID=A0A9J5W1E1_SOLCO|nr:hypothetical protein H5410_059075 [Solanum commersonii]